MNSKKRKVVREKVVDYGELDLKDGRVVVLNPCPYSIKRRWVGKYNFFKFFERNKPNVFLHYFLAADVKKEYDSKEKVDNFVRKEKEKNPLNVLSGRGSFYIENFKQNRGNPAVYLIHDSLLLKFQEFLSMRKLKKDKRLVEELEHLRRKSRHLELKNKDLEQTINEYTSDGNIVLKGHLKNELDSLKDYAKSKVKTLESYHNFSFENEIVVFKKKAPTLWSLQLFLVTSSPKYRLTSDSNKKKKELHVFFDISVLIYQNSRFYNYYSFLYCMLLKSTMSTCSGIDLFNKFSGICVSSQVIYNHLNELLEKRELEFLKKSGTFIHTADNYGKYDRTNRIYTHSLTNYTSIACEKEFFYSEDSPLYDVEKKIGLEAFYIQIGDIFNIFKEGEVFVEKYRNGVERKKFGMSEFDNNSIIIWPQMLGYKSSSNIDVIKCHEFVKENYLVIEDNQLLLLNDDEQIYSKFFCYKKMGFCSTLVIRPGFFHNLWNVHSSLFYIYYDFFFSEVEDICGFRHVDPECTNFLETQDVLRISCLCLNQYFRKLLTNQYAYTLKNVRGFEKFRKDVLSQVGVPLRFAFLYSLYESLNKLMGIHARSEKGEFVDNFMNIEFLPLRREAHKNKYSYLSVMFKIMCFIMDPSARRIMKENACCEILGYTAAWDFVIEKLHFLWKLYGLKWDETSSPNLFPFMIEILSIRQKLEKRIADLLDHKTTKKKNYSKFSPENISKIMRWIENTFGKSFDSLNNDDIETTNWSNNVDPVSFLLEYKSRENTNKYIEEKLKEYELFKDNLNQNRSIEELFEYLVEEEKKKLEKKKKKELEGELDDGEKSHRGSDISYVPSVQSEEADVDMESSDNNYQEEVKELLDGVEVEDIVMEDSTLDSERREELSDGGRTEEQVHVHVPRRSTRERKKPRVFRYLARNNQV